MGLDIQFGLAFGISTKDYFSMADEDVKVTRYNEITGEPIVKTQFRTVFTFHKDFLGIKVGEKVTRSKFYDMLCEIDETSSGNLVFPEYNMYFIGFSHPDYQYGVNDFVLPLDTDLSEQQKLWEKHFPNIPGNKFAYTLVSS